MEVHHHGDNHHNKTWKSYFLEFLMLFLAVSAGFLAENLREEYVEHNRAKTYSAQLLMDLQTDSVLISQMKSARINQAIIVDSLITELEKKANQRNDTILTRLASQFGNHSMITPNNATYKEMMATGALRYFDPEVTAYLKAYHEFQFKQFDLLQNSENQKTVNLISPLINEMVNGKFVKSMVDGKYYDGPTGLMLNDEIHLNQLYNYARYEKDVIVQINKNFILLRDQNKSIIELIKMEAHLKGELGILED